jgi:hypothetical protein
LACSVKADLFIVWYIGGEPMNKSVIRDIHQVIPLLDLSFIPQPLFQPLKTVIRQTNEFFNY